MMINVSAPTAQPEGNSLPPPRAFGEANTFTVPRGKSSMIAGAPIWARPGPAEANGVRFRVIPADAGPLTITF